MFFRGVYISLEGISNQRKHCNNWKRNIHIVTFIRERNVPFLCIQIFLAWTLLALDFKQMCQGPFHQRECYQAEESESLLAEILAKRSWSLKLFFLSFFFPILSSVSICKSDFLRASLHLRAFLQDLNSSQGKPLVQGFLEASFVDNAAKHVPLMVHK